MSGDAVKAYVYLLCASWLEIPRATLPVDDEKLAQLARLKLDEWMHVKNDVLQHYQIGKCNEHLGRFYQETLLEISRKSENMQRFNNKNAKRTQIKRRMNATHEEEREDEIDIDNTLSFEEYLKEEEVSYQVLIADTVWIEGRKKYHPQLNVLLSLEKAHNDFWHTEAGYKHAKRQKAKNKNWKRTYENALTMKSNQVWKTNKPKMGTHVFDGEGD